MAQVAPPPAQAQHAAAPGGTRPENLQASRKRIRGGPSIYANLLPLTPPSLNPTIPSFVTSLLSTVPFLSLSPPRVDAVYDELTQTVWVSRPDDMMLLWRRGFFGKGTLSRSEPSWQRRVQNKIALLEGKEQDLTSEEYTAIRRKERKLEKLVKQKEREAEKLAAAAASGLPVHSQEPSMVDGMAHVAKSGGALAQGSANEDSPPDADEPATPAFEPEERPPAWHLEAEHLQLQPEEAFFLLFAVGCIDLKQGSPLDASENQTGVSDKTWSILTAWQTFLHDMALLAHDASPSLPMQLALKVDPRFNRFDSPFLLNYAVYHHFRSMGWVTRSGVKFCSDWVLYGPGGPVGGHAEQVHLQFSVVVVPNYVDPSDKATNPFRSTFVSDMLGEGERRDSWRWFHTINRIRNA
ncbi:tRNA splicing endonuclease subunit sen2 [Microbotryomycetes sp. JL201]|nr:tRNA splicing endonuclease subunit sen2 [Microbotryomycetes sp. JL201]